MMKSIRKNILVGMVLFCSFCLPSVLGANSSPEGEDFKKALELYKAQKYPQALTAFQRLEQEPSGNLSIEAVFMQGQILRAMQKWPEAEPIFSKVADAFPEMADYARYYQGEALRMKEEKGRALQVFRNLIASHPQSLLIPKAYLQMAEILFDQGDLSEAASLCDRVIQSNGKKDLSAQALFLLAQTKEKMEAWPEAAKSYQEVWLRHPLHPKAKPSLAKYEALRKEKKIPEMTLPPEALFRRTQAFYQARFYEAAASEMEKLPGFPSQAYPARYAGESWIDELYFQRGMISFWLKKPSQAADTFLLIYKNARQGDIGERAFYWRCRALQRSGQREEVLNAVASYPKVFPAGTYGDRILQIRAEILEERGNLEEAISVYREIPQKFPHSSLVFSAYWKAGWLLFQNQDSQGAIQNWQVLETLKSTSPWSEKSLYWKARAMEKLGKRELSEEMDQRLRQQFPGSYYTQLSLNRGSFPYPPKGFGPLQEVSLASFWNGKNASGEEKNLRLKKGALLVRWHLFAEAQEELEAAGASEGVKEEMRLEISRLLREMGEYHRSTLLVRRNFSIRPLPPTLTERERSLYLLAYPIGNPNWINQNAQKQSLDPALLSAVILEESRFDPQALSVSGARGLMQIMPATGKDIAKKLQVRPYGDQNLYDPELNIRFGSWYLARLLEDFGGKAYLAVAAYNAGPRAVRDWLARSPGLAEDEFVEKIPYLETRNYVVRVLTSYQIYRTLYPRT